tara:strand:- start:4484 stop:5344 length:861 start_codon:yes stop_codon:yes gene_type:complete
MNFKNKINSLPSIKKTIQNNFLTPKKSLGQNFILDLNITNKIAKLANCSKKKIIEIGPGPGSLTRSILLEGAESVVAIEKDLRMINCLKELKIICDEKLNLINNDILNLTLNSLGPFPKSIIGNLPYNISSKLIISWLKEMHYNKNVKIDNITITIQKELADRLISSKDTKEYGRISVYTQLLSNVSRLLELSPSNFYPKPKVFSSVINIIPLEKPRFKVNLETFEKIVKQAFGNRRKMLRQSLKNLGGDKLLEMSNVNSSLRAENLSVEDFCFISNIFDKKFKSL